MSNAEKNTPKTVKEWADEIDSKIDEEILFDAIKKAVDYGWIPEEVDTFTYMKNIDRIASLLQAHTNQTLQELKTNVEGLSYTEIEVLRRKQTEDGSFSGHRENTVVVELQDVITLIDETINE